MKSKTKSINRICRVCGDQATAFNFGGLSCDSCKIFFRRNGSNVEKLECYFTGQCEINILSRRFCSKCRMVKCFAIGMELRWLDRRKALQAKAICNSKIDIQEHTTEHQNKDETVITKNSAESTELTEREWQYISDIENAMQIFVDERTLPVAGCAKNLSEANSYFGLYARRIIKFCKHFPAFRDLSRADQFTILKPFYMEIFAVRNTFNHKNNPNGFPLIENESGDKAILVPYELYPKFDGAYHCGLFMNSLDREIENDPVIKNLLIVQFLFSPRENLKNFEAISSQYHWYHYLLKRYLSHKYRDTLKGDIKYDHLICLINNYFGQMKKDVLKMFEQFIDFKQTGQVISELYSTKFS